MRHEVVLPNDIRRDVEYCGIGWGPTGVPTQFFRIGRCLRGDAHPHTGGKLVFEAVPCDPPPAGMEYWKVGPTGRELEKVLGRRSYNL